MEAFVRPSRQRTPLSPAPQYQSLQPQRCIEFEPGPGAAHSIRPSGERRTRPYESGRDAMGNDCAIRRARRSVEVLAASDNPRKAGDAIMVWSCAISAARSGLPPLPVFCILDTASDSICNGFVGMKMALA